MLGHRQSKHRIRRGFTDTLPEFPTQNWHVVGIQSTINHDFRSELPAGRTCGRTVTLEIDDLLVAEPRTDQNCYWQTQFARMAHVTKVRKQAIFFILERIKEE
jgi:hypothetical protein